MLDKQRIVEVIEANLFAPVNPETRKKIADALGVAPDKVLLGSKVISIIDGDEVYRLQVAETGVITFLETDIQLAQAVLSDSFLRDPVGMWLLCTNRVPTTEAMTQSGMVVPTIVKLGSAEQATISALDLVNGILFAMTGQRLSIGDEPPKEGNPQVDLSSAGTQ
jgi:hypothetical protein